MDVGLAARAGGRRGLFHERQNGPRRLRGERAGRGREDGRRDGHRVGVDARGGVALLGGWDNEVFLLVANRRSRRRPDDAHPLGYGREAYVWALLAALGPFVAGAAVSVTHGVQELVRPEAATDFVVGYAALGVSFALGRGLVSFSRSVRQAKSAAQLMERDLIEQVMATSDPTLRAVFAEDLAALSRRCRRRR